MLELLGASHPPVVLALPDIKQGRCRVGSRSRGGHLQLLLHLLPFRLPLCVRVCRISGHD